MLVDRNRTDIGRSAERLRQTRIGAVAHPIRGIRSRLER
jgi:hypothetical protein